MQQFLLSSSLPIHPAKRKDELNVKNISKEKSRGNGKLANHSIQKTPIHDHFALRIAKFSPLQLPDRLISKWLIPFHRSSFPLPGNNHPKTKTKEKKTTGWILRVFHPHPEIWRLSHYLETFPTKSPTFSIPLYSRNVVYHTPYHCKQSITYRTIAWIYLISPIVWQLTKSTTSVLLWKVSVML